MTHPRGDLLAVIDDNRSYSKLNPYVQETASYAVAIEPNGWADAALSLRYHVNPSPANLEGMGPGTGIWGSKHDYQDFIRVYVPAGSRLLAETGLAPWAPTLAYGLTQFAGRLLVPQRSTRTVVFHYRIPPGSVDGAGAYTLTVQRQPGANLISVTILLSGRGGVLIRPAGSNSVHRLLSLDGRLTHLDVPLTGISGGTGPHLSQPTGDPYVPYSFI